MVVVVDADAAGTDLSVYAFVHYFILLFSHLEQSVMSYVLDFYDVDC